MTLDDLAARLGVHASLVDGATRVRRGDVVASFPFTLTTDTIAARHRAFCVLHGTRLGVDRLNTRYDLSTERSPSTPARNVYEMPSTYGERLQTLVPTAAIDIAESISGSRAVRQRWLPGLDAELLLVREIARELHWLSTDDLDELPYTLDNVREYARLALFYDAYRFRPARVEEIPGGVVRHYETRDGSAMSRATLLPDFDYDAARAEGAFLVLDRNAFLVVEPRGDRSAALAAFADIARGELETAPCPISSTVWCMTDGRIERCADATVGVELEVEPIDAPAVITGLPGDNA